MSDLAQQMREKAQGSIDAAFWRYAADELERLRADAERLDWLEDFVAINNEIHLHDGHHPRGTGLGLVGRTLRAAIDAARGENK